MCGRWRLTVAGVEEVQDGAEGVADAEEEDFGGLVASGWISGERIRGAWMRTRYSCPKGRLRVH